MRLPDAVGSTYELLVGQDTVARQENQNGVDHRQRIDGGHRALIDGQENVPHEDERNAKQTELCLTGTLPIYKYGVDGEYGQESLDDVYPLPAHHEAHNGKDSCQEQEDRLYTLNH